MSYNQRRGNQGNIGNIGNRRPVVTNNFVPGGQLTPQKGGIQQGQAQTPATRMQQNQATPPKQKVVPQQQQQQQQVPQPATPQQPKPQDVKPENGTTENTDGEKKKWTHAKIPNRERIRRRNVRLSKLLQPKNALMILNEIAKQPIYTFSDFVSVGGPQFKATVTVDGVQHDGFGKNKNDAKNDAAEKALKHLVRQKKIEKMAEKNTDGQEMMDTTEEDDVDNPLPWKQVASFALFKLFNSWGENPKTIADESGSFELKPARRMPDNPGSLNPLMLINQMYPNTQFEEVSRTGQPPNPVVFTVKCVVNGQAFTGTGNNKKVAKKNAAYEACCKVLGVEYAPDVYTPQ